MCKIWLLGYIAIEIVNPFVGNVLMFVKLP